MSAQAAWSLIAVLVGLAWVASGWFAVIHKTPSDLASREPVTFAIMVFFNGSIAGPLMWLA